MAAQACRIDTAQSLHIPRISSRMRPGFRAFTSWTFGSPDHARSRVHSDQWRSHAHHLAIQRQVRHGLLQPRVLVLELLQPLHLGRKQPGILLLPVEVGRLADPGLAADLSNRRALVALLDDERLLRVREIARLHPFPLLSQPGKRRGKLQPQSVQFPGSRSGQAGLRLVAEAGQGSGGARGVVSIPVRMQIHSMRKKLQIHAFRKKIW